MNFIKPGQTHVPEIIQKIYAIIRIDGKEKLGTLKLELEFE